MYQVVMYMYIVHAPVLYFLFGQWIKMYFSPFVFPGAPEVSLTGVRAEINVKVVSLGGGKHRCNYIPVVPGAYLLNITWNGRQLRGAPYKVNVIGTFYPQKVSVTGEGLRGGILGRPMDIAIDTRKAGPGEFLLTFL